MLRARGLQPERVVIEITEREHADDIERLRRQVIACRSAGLLVAADDVGAGNAGLRLLSQIPFDIVKVDLSLVHDGTNRESTLAVLRSVGDLARRWNAFVIAEGLETTEHLRTVREVGITAGQGYLLGRPGDDTDLAPVDLASLEGAGGGWFAQAARARNGATASPAAPVPDSHSPGVADRDDSSVHAA